jgi:uncharacterized protein (TIGR02598 family)
MKRFLQTTASFSLVEVTLAIGVAGFCLIAVFGLLPVGVQTNQRSISQTAATAVLSSVVADLRATPITSTTSPQYVITFGTAKTLYFDGGGASSTDISGTTKPNGSSWIPPLQIRYRLDVTFPTNSAGANAATFAYMRVTWPVPPNAQPLPATPDPNTTSGSNEMFAAFNRN